jgi:large subunit ribosomal protein L18
MPRMAIPKTSEQRRKRRHLRVRRHLGGTAERPRLVVFRSLKHIYAQLVDDVSRRTLLTVSDGDIAGKKSDRALEVGKQLAARAKDSGITRVVFDRAGYRYHGRVKALATGAREGGLEF